MKKQLMILLKDMAEIIYKNTTIIGSILPI